MPLFEMIYTYLKFDNWDFEYDEINEIIHIEMEGENNNYEEFIIIDDDTQNIIVQTYANGLIIPKRYRSSACEFINRINLNLVSGNFEIDLDNGEIRFRASLNLINAKPSKKQMDHFIWLGVKIFDDYYSELIWLKK